MVTAQPGNTKATADSLETSPPATPPSPVTASNKNLRKSPLAEAVSPTPGDDESWLVEMRRACREPRSLGLALGLPEDVIIAAEATIRHLDQPFPLFAPLPFVRRMQFGDLTDPLLRQVWPHAKETQVADGFRKDPVADQAAQVGPGIIRKYPGRALIVLSGACAIHCRYCFRRHFPYHDSPHGVDAWRDALRPLADDQSLEEIILSGGDPLTWRDAMLAELFQELAKFPYLKRLRVHTRLPIVIPQRITTQFIDALCSGPWQPIVVVHVNHPQEIDDAVAEAMERLTATGMIVLNQSVLLHGINDDVDTLVALNERLLSLRVMPYYLHQLDRVDGAAHFEVGEEIGRQLMTSLQRRLPGYAIPRWVRDEGLQLSKSWLA